MPVPSFFCGSLITVDTGSFKNVQKCFDLLVEVGHMTKWWVLICNELFGSNFLGSLIRTHRKLCKCVVRHFSPIYESRSNFEVVWKWVMGPSWCPSLLRWFKFTLKPPYTIASGNLLSAIWDTSHWTSFVKFGLKTAWDISYDILWPILKYVNFWRLQGCSSNLSKKDAFRKSIFSRWRSDKALTRLMGFRWAGP